VRAHQNPRSGQPGSGVFRLVALTGYAGSGKSEAARYLVERHHFVRLRYAAPMKKMIMTLLVESGVGPITAREMIDGKLKETPSPVLAGHSPRFALQTLGTEWGRNILARDFWRRLLMGRVEAEVAKGNSVVIDDVRFFCEARELRARGFTLLRIQRPGVERGEHSSEDQSFPVDHVIQNDESIPTLHERLEEKLTSSHGV
jgi:hypothetical protein